MERINGEKRKKGKRLEGRQCVGEMMEKQEKEKQGEKGGIRRSKLINIKQKFPYI
jgi:hypothetical protein